ncbi:hypothetical protein OKA06_06380 [Novosphingobium sp. MW5]|nr:hypothetical protein [Novosphingobium sp. MW5]
MPRRKKSLRFIKIRIDSSWLPINGGNTMRNVASILALISMSGCASTPPVTTHYYGARSTLELKMVRTLGCDAQNLPVIATTVTPSVAHLADPAQPRSIAFKGIDGSMANSDITMELTADGRLKSINATTTGQGETIIKAAIKLAEAALEGDDDKSPIITACKAFKARFADKPQTAAYVWAGSLSEAGPTIQLKPDPLSSDLATDFIALLGEPCLRLGAVEAPASPATVSPDYAARFKGVIIEARQPARRELAVSVGPKGSCEANHLWTGYASVAQSGTDYKLYVPKAALFGKQVFAASFDDAGGLIKLQYAKESGAANAIGVAQAGLEALQTTPAEKLAAIKAEADMIAAQERLVKCRATPDKC